MDNVITGPVFVVQDNIDTDQIIPAEFLNLIPTIKEEYEKLGSFALWGSRIPLPHALRRRGRAGQQIPHCRGRPELHAAVPVSTRRSRWVPPTAKWFWPKDSPAFSSATAWPPARSIRAEVTQQLCEELKTGDVVTVDLEAATVTVKESGKFSFKPLGDVKPVVDAGGLFRYARKAGMIPA